MILLHWRLTILQAAIVRCQSRAHRRVDSALFAQGGLEQAQSRACVQTSTYQDAECRGLDGPQVSHRSHANRMLLRLMGDQLILHFQRPLLLPNQVFRHPTACRDALGPIPLGIKHRTLLRCHDGWTAGVQDRLAAEFPSCSQWVASDR
jgi:hypothetical protein